MMKRSLLHIGEVAALLGVTRKAIRHYHKLGLLAEPERSESGYRLYSAADLFALQRIQQLQSIGFSLQRIKFILESPESDKLLQETLNSLRDELDRQIDRLQARRTQIDSLLQQQATLQQVSVPDGNPPVYQLSVNLFGNLLKTLPAEAIEKERQFWASLDGFHWPASYHDRLQAWLHELAQRPGLQEQLLMINARYLALSDRSPDDPEVRLLAEEVVQNQLFLALDAESLPMPPQFLQMFQQVIDQLTEESASPAQQKFFQTIREILLTPNPAS